MLVSLKHFYHIFEHFLSMSYQHRTHFPFQGCVDITFSTLENTHVKEVGEGQGFVLITCLAKMNEVTPCLYSVIFAFALGITKDSKTYFTT